MELLDAAADLIWIRRLHDHSILHVNKTVERRLGWTRADLLGKSAAVLYAADAQRLLGAVTEDVRKHGQASALVSLAAKDGRRVEAELRCSRVRYEGADAALIIARELGEEARDRRAALAVYEAFRRSNDVMFFCDKNGIILDVNDAFCRRYGYKRGEVLGQNPRILRSKHSTDELYKRMWSSILDPNKGFWRGEMVNQAKDGREIPLVLTITAVKNAQGEIVGYVSNALDMTEQRALQERVAQSEALASVGEMAAIVAHEIRNPLGSIVMASRQLAAGQLDAGDRAEVVRVIKTESQRLNEVLSSFLSFARPRELKLGRADLDALTREICAMASPSVEVRTGGLPTMTVDADQLRQVIWNLVINARQAAGESGQVRVTTGREPGWFFVAVEDSGPGIPPEQLAKIFKPFHTTKRQGTGLGLPVAERAAHAHGGRIDVAGSDLGGAKFTLWLPGAEA